MDIRNPQMDHPLSPQDALPSQKPHDELHTLIASLHRFSTMMNNITVAMNHGQHELPEARERLKSASNAHEEATMSIMNDVDIITALISSVQQSLFETRRSLEGLNKLVREAQRSHEYSLDPTIRNYVDVLYNAVSAHELDFVHCVNNVFSTTERITQSAVNISMALQVNDITAQQLAGAGQMVERVEHTLKHLLDENANPRPEPEVTAEAFNTYASFAPTEDRQKMIDDLFQQVQLND